MGAIIEGGKPDWKAHVFPMIEYAHLDLPEAIHEQWLGAFLNVREQEVQRKADAWADKAPEKDSHKVRSDVKDAMLRYYQSPAHKADVAKARQNITERRRRHLKVLGVNTNRDLGQLFADITPVVSREQE